MQGMLSKHESCQFCDPTNQEGYINANFVWLLLVMRFCVFSLWTNWMDVPREFCKYPMCAHMHARTHAIARVCRMKILQSNQLILQAKATATNE